MSPTNPSNPYRSPQTHDSTTRGEVERNAGDATGGVIPYKNPHALIAYYLGIIACIPLIGLPFGIASLILGIMGLVNRKKNPAIKGSVHAWIGILGGCFSLFCGGALIVSIAASML